MIFRYEQTDKASPAPGVTRRVLARGGKIMAVQVTFEKGAVGDVHSHSHEQVCYVVSGSFTYEEAGEKTTIRQGDSYYVAPDVPHGVVALESGVLLDIFTPQRKDFLDK